MKIYYQLSVLLTADHPGLSRQRLEKELAKTLLWLPQLKGKLKKLGIDPDSIEIEEVEAVDGERG